MIFYKIFVEITGTGSKKVRKWSPRGGKVSQRPPNVSQLEPKGRPKGTNGSPKGAKGRSKGAKGSHSAAKMHPKINFGQDYEKYICLMISGLGYGTKIHSKSIKNQ